MKRRDFKLIICPVFTVMSLLMTAGLFNNFRFLRFFLRFLFEWFKGLFVHFGFLAAGWYKLDFIWIGAILRQRRALLSEEFMWVEDLYTNAIILGLIQLLHSGIS
jgi:hypothetical protein